MKLCIILSVFFLLFCSCGYVYTSQKKRYLSSGRVREYKDKEPHVFDTIRIITPYIIHYPEWYDNSDNLNRNYRYIDSFTSSFLGSINLYFKAKSVCVKHIEYNYSNKEKNEIEEFIKNYKKGKATSALPILKNTSNSSFLFVLLDYKHAMSLTTGGMSAGGGGSGRIIKALDIEANLFMLNSNEIIYYRNMYERSAVKREYHRSALDWNLFTEQLFKRFPFEWMAKK